MGEGGGETLKGNKDRTKKKITITYLHTPLDSKLQHLTSRFVKYNVIINTNSRLSF